MGIVCPNISHPDFKKLVDSVGEDRAIEMFVNNNNEVPHIEGTKRGIERVLGKLSMPFRSTMDLMNQNPKVANELIERLQEQFPEVRIAKDRILDKDGNYIEFQPGEKGMHYRNAFQSVVAWSNDAYLETPPHEYAHHYIEMFYDVPLVQQAIEEYGGIEPLAEMMGRYYANQVVGNKAINFIKKFWRKVKAYFGNVDVGYQLADAFHNAKKLDKSVSPGLATINYQKGGDVRKRYGKTGYDVRKRGFAESAPLVPTPVSDREELYDKKGKEVLAALGINLRTFDPARPEKTIRKISKAIDTFKKTHTFKANDKIMYKSSLIDPRLFEELEDRLHEYDGKLMQEIVEAFTTDRDLPKSIYEGHDLVSLLGKMKIANDYKELKDDSILDGEGGIFSLDDAVSKALSEAKDGQATRKRMYDKYIKNKTLKKIFKKLERAMLYQINARLTTKYLSGSGSSFISDALYKALNNAENLRNDLIFKFNEKMMLNEFSDNHSKWSYFKKKGSREFTGIDSLMTETHAVTREDGSADNVKFTKAEMLSIYLMNRQDRARSGLLKKGIILNDVIEGRNVKSNETLKLPISTIQNIVASIDADPAMQEVIKGIDEAMKYMEGEVSSTYFNLNGLPFETQDNYFPVYTGKKSYEQRQSRSSIDDFKSINLALGTDSAIRIVDPIQVVNGYKVSAATYSAMAIPIENGRKIIKNIEDEFVGTDEYKYIESLKTVMNQLEDRSQLYSGQGQQDFEKFINRMTSNFTLSVLGMNIPVMAKQSISYITALESIDGKYLRQAGYGTSWMPVINPREILDAMEWNGSGGQTKLPLEWNLDTNKGNFALMKKHSPMLAARLEGMATREMAEALMNQDVNDDIIEIPGIKKKDGTTYKISKTRFMEGIRVFDAVTIENIWRAAEFEAEQEFGLTRGTPEFYEHVAIRTEEIVSESQPNNNITDKSALSNQNDPISRAFTMFSSATQKIAQLQIDSVITYLNQPTSANLQRMLKTSANGMITTSLMMTAIDALRTALLHGWDDDDAMLKDLMIAGGVNGLSYYHGLGTLIRAVGSQLDDKPFYQSLQHPVEGMMQELVTVLASLGKGDVFRAASKSLELSMKGTGFAMSPWLQGKAAFNRYVLEE